MKFSSSLAASLLLAQAACAEFTVQVISATLGGKPVDPSTVVLEPRPVRQLANSSSTASARSLPVPPPRSARRTAAKERRQTTTPSSDWCGALQHSPSTDHLAWVSGYFLTPQLSLRPSTATPQYVAAWIGMDGASCQSTLLQAGVTSAIAADGSESASAWFEWVPDAAYNIPSFPVSQGDWIWVNVSASSTTSAIIDIEDLSGNSVTFSLSGGTTLCRADAEWIVEDPYSGAGQVPFASFADVWFEEVEAMTAGGEAIGVDGATMVYLENTGPNPSCTATEYDDGDFFCSSS